MGTKGNVILEETMTPGSLAESFETTIKSYQADNDKDNNEPEKINESEDPDKKPRYEPRSSISSILTSSAPASHFKRFIKRSRIKTLWPTR